MTRLLVDRSVSFVVDRNGLVNFVAPPSLDVDVADGDRAETRLDGADGHLDGAGTAKDKLVKGHLPRDAHQDDPVS